MLSESEREAIDREAAALPLRSAACIEALRAVQRERGWVSDESLAAIADYLDVTEAELENVATFYNLIFRRPVGRHVILVCDSVSCWITGYAQLVERLSQKLGIGFGETTADGRFTMLPIACLGACERAPALMIDEDLHTRVDEIVSDRQLSQLLERYP